MREDIDTLRRRIDGVDRKLLLLLEERMELGLRTRAYKDIVSDERRERAVLGRAEDSGLALVKEAFAVALFEAIIAESRRLQESGMPTVAFQGEHGAYSEVAARALAPTGAYMPCAGFEEIFEGVEEGRFDLGVIPVENSLEGAVTQVHDQLFKTRLWITAEVSVPVHHCLLACEDLDHRDLRTVYSHPQALAQCAAFLGRLGLEARPYYDTAGAAMMIARDHPASTAAIASELAAGLFGLRILARQIADARSNSTRFVAISKEPAASGDKCSIAITAADRAGSLSEILAPFAAAEINLTRITSAPVRGDRERVGFLLDFEGSSSDETIARILAGVKASSATFRLLGCYPACRC